jgi:hypothetical protein
MDGNNFVPLTGALDAETFSYTDIGLTNGSRYYYSASANNANGEGPRSAVVSEYPNTVPNAPVISGLTNSNSQGAGEQHIELDPKSCKSYKWSNVSYCIGCNQWQRRRCAMCSSCICSIMRT